MSTAKSSSNDLRSEFDRLDCEFRAYHVQKAADESTIEKTFAELDTDKDGLVTFEVPTSLQEIKPHKQ
ncbi:unnamed protein product [Rotaria sp. Silwood1]|nr:unnamed protein product [Rotaria sp. Silwood1]CAF4686411.1 unnamed protein product [Rotaria sp. Silwood1]CAF4737673.1 unnamed protein product [Rotaria sp. Silwood1]